MTILRLRSAAVADLEDEAELGAGGKLDAGAPAADGREHRRERSEPKLRLGAPDRLDSRLPRVAMQDDVLHDHNGVIDQ